MTDQLNAFASEVTRVAREVGTEGKLGGQADVRGVAGTWRDLTDSVNSMAGNLTGQVRNIADVTTAVAKGDLSKKITVAVRGEILELKNTMNTMVDQLQLVRLGSDARGARSRHRRPARRPGRRARRRRHVEGPHRLGELDGRQPDQPGAQHRRRDDRRGARRPVQEDHRRRARRNPRAEGHRQHDGGPAQLVRRRSDARGEGSRHRRQAGRPGRRARRRRHVEGPHRQRQPPRRQPHHPGARHRRSRDRRHQGRPVAVDQRRSGRRSRGPQGQHQRDDRQPARDDGEEHRAGLAEDQPREVHAPAAGPARPRHGVAHDSLGAGAARADAARRHLLQRIARRRRAGSAAAGQLRLHRRRQPANALPRR